MSATFSMRIHLRGLVLALTVFSAIAATANALYASYCVQRDQLIANTRVQPRLCRQAGRERGQLPEGRAAATALQRPARGRRVGLARRARGRGEPGAGTERQLQFRGHRRRGRRHPGGLAKLSRLSRRARRQPGSRAALQARQALISPPYVSIAGNLLITLSHPIYSRDGRYRGYIAGSIHLRNERPAGTAGPPPLPGWLYLYVVDRDGKLIYHVDPSRLGEDVSHNPVVAAVKQGESGARRLLNTKDVDMLAGCAVVTSSGWGIIAQRPTAVTLEPIQELIWALLGYAAPGDRFPAGDLVVRSHDLAAARAAGDQCGTSRCGRRHATRPVGKAWYFEAERLKHAVIWASPACRRRSASSTWPASPIPSPACATGAACRTPSSKCAPRPSAMA